MTYFIVTQSFAKGMEAEELSSLIARHIRASEPGIRTEQIVQFPIVDGGDGMVETLVTLLLGSFLEVDATGASGVPIVAPIGFIGEESNIALLRLGSIIGLTPDEVQMDQPVYGTSYGAGELIQDALDEGAFSVVLGLDEPLARDGGLGLAAALGVKFFDVAGNQLDLSKPIPDLFEKIVSVDATARSFEVLSARFFLARSRKRSSGFSSQRAEFERLNEILMRDCGCSVDLKNVELSESGIEFGVQAFFTTQVQEGSGLILQASGIEARLKDLADRQLIIVADSLDSVFGNDAFDAMKKIVEIADEQAIPITVLTNQKAAETNVADERAAHPSIEQMLSLAEAPLFVQPLALTASEDEIRRDQKMRVEKLAPALFTTGKATAEAAPEISRTRSKSAAKSIRPQ